MLFVCSPEGQRLKNNKTHTVCLGPGELGRKKGSRKSVWAKSSFFGATVNDWPAQVTVGKWMEVVNVC